MFSDTFYSMRENMTRRKNLLQPVLIVALIKCDYTKSNLQM